MLSLACNGAGLIRNSHAKLQNLSTNYLSYVVGIDGFQKCLVGIGCRLVLAESITSRAEVGCKTLWNASLTQRRSATRTRIAVFPTIPITYLILEKSASIVTNFPSGKNTTTFVAACGSKS